MYLMYVVTFFNQETVVLNVIPSNGKIATFLSQTNNLWDDCFLHKKVDTPVCGADMSLKKITSLRNLKLSCKGRGEPGEGGRGDRAVKGKVSCTRREETTGPRMPGRTYQSPQSCLEFHYLFSCFWFKCLQCPCKQFHIILKKQVQDC